MLQGATTRITGRSITAAGVSAASRCCCPRPASAPSPSGAALLPLLTPPRLLLAAAQLLPLKQLLQVQLQDPLLHPQFAPS